MLIHAEDLEVEKKRNMKEEIDPVTDIKDRIVMMKREIIKIENIEINIDMIRETTGKMTDIVEKKLQIIIIPEKMRKMKKELKDQCQGLQNHHPLPFYLFELL